MFSKIFYFLFKSAVWGLVAFILAMIFTVLLGFLFGVTMIPLEIITSGSTKIFSTSFGNWSFRIIFTIFFLEMMLRSYKKPGLEERFKNFVNQGEEDWE